MLNRGRALLTALTACLIACDDGITDSDRIAIGLTPATDTLFKLASIQLTPNVTEGGAPASPPITWSSSDTLVATVSSTGLVRARGTGTAVITARVQSAEALATIVVDSLREVQLTPEGPALFTGDSVQLAAVGIGALRTAALTDDVAWSTDDPAIATVSANGTVVARGPGITRIVATQHLTSGATTFGVMSVSANRHPACTGRGTLHQGREAAPIGTWRAADGPHYLYDSVYVTRLTVEPGTTVCGLPGSALVLDPAPDPGALLDARGTSGQPIRFTAADTLKLWRGIDGLSGTAHFTFANASVELASRGVVGWGGVLSIHDSRFYRAFVEYCGVVTRVDIRRTVFDSKGICISDGTFEDNVIRGAGLLIFRDRAVGGVASVLRCTITDSPVDGIQVLSGATAEIHDCNFERNAGFGVNNLDTTSVDARGNWWGDPAGPAGPLGDGVSGNVDTSGHLSSPSTR